MGWIVDGLINQICSFILSAMCSLLDQATKLFSCALGTDPTTFQKVFPITENFSSAFKGIGFALIISLFMLGAFRNIFSGLGFAGENPVKMVIRTIIAFVLVACLSYGMNLVYSASASNGGVFSTLYTELGNIPDSNGSNQISEGTFSGINTGSVAALTTGGVSSIVGMIITIIFIVAIGINMIKLLLEMVERYLLLNVLIFFAPLVGAAVTLETTLKIFSSYLKMYFGQLFMLLLNLVTLKIVSSGIGSVSRAFEGTFGNIGLPDTTFVPYMVMMIVLAFLKISQRFDNYMRDIGMTVGITGGSLLEEMVAGGKAVSGITHSVFGGGKSKGGGGSGSDGLLGRHGMLTTARGGIVGVAGAALSAAKETYKSRTQAGHELGNLTTGKAFASAFNAKFGGTGLTSDSAKKMINSKATVSNSAARSAGSGLYGISNSSAYRAISEELNKGTQEVGKNGFDITSLKRVQMGNGAVVGMNNNGDLCAFTQQKPSFVDSSVSTHIDSNGETWYSQNLTNANREFQKQEGFAGQTYSGYENTLASYNNEKTSDFRGVGGRVQVPNESPISQPSTSQAPVPSSEMAKSGILKPDGTGEFDSSLGKQNFNGDSSAQPAYSGVNNTINAESTEYANNRYEKNDNGFNDLIRGKQLEDSPIADVSVDNHSLNNDEPLDIVDLAKSVERKNNNSNQIILDNGKIIKNDNSN